MNAVFSSGLIGLGAYKIYSGCEMLSSEKEDQEERSQAKWNIVLGVAAAVAGVYLNCSTYSTEPLEPKVVEFKERAISHSESIKSSFTLPELPDMNSPTGSGIYQCDVGPLANSRSDDLILIDTLPKEDKVELDRLAKHLHSTESVEIIKITNNTQRQKADEFAHQMYSEFLAPFRKDGLTEENAVAWIDLRGVDLDTETGKKQLDTVSSEFPHFFSLSSWINKIDSHVAGSKTFFENGREHSFAFVSKNRQLSENQILHRRDVGLDQRYFPPGVAAIHELMHVQENCGVRLEECMVVKQSGFRSFEHLTTLKTLILNDEIHKKVHNIAMEEVVDYENRGYRIEIPLPGYDPSGDYENWDKYTVRKFVPIGKIANFYRDLEKSFGNLAKALVSSESLDFLRGVDKCAVPSPFELEANAS